MRSKQRAIHSRKAGKVPKDDWRTPKRLFEYLNLHYHFGLDAAACARSALCDYYFDKKLNALDQDWSGYGNVFLNHPYSMNKEFITKCAEHSGSADYTIVNLGPADTSTEYFSMYLDLANYVFFIKGRLKFIGAEQGAPFGSALYIFGENKLTSNVFAKVQVLELSPQQRGF